MPRFDNRTLAMLLVLSVVLLLILNPGGIMFALGVIQSIVIIILGVVATMYLWKRM